MEFATIASTFGVLFLAELGDKTQLTVFSLVSGGRDGLSVFIGATLALALSTALAVVAGTALTRVVDPNWLKLGAAVLLLGFGAVVLRDAIIGLRAG